MRIHDTSYPLFALFDAISTPTSHLGTEFTEFTPAHILPHTLPCLSLIALLTRVLSKQRQDVALALLRLATAPTKVTGLGIDMAGGGIPIGPAIDEFIEKGVTDWLGQA